MTSEHEQLLALRREAEEQRRRFGGAGPCLSWWANAWLDGSPLPKNEKLVSYSSNISHVAHIGDLLNRHFSSPKKPEWFRNLGFIRFDPRDKLPKASVSFCELANRIGCVLEPRHPELIALIAETEPSIKAKDWTLAWIFKKRFADYAGISHVVVPDAFGCLIECIDELLATMTPSPTVPASVPVQNDADQLAKYQAPLTALQRRILEALWSRKHLMKFDTLMSEVWEGEIVLHSSIARRLKAIRRRWAEKGLVDIDFEISIASQSVKLIKPSL